MKWLAKLFYYGRIKRLERIQTAAALIAAGKTDQAETLLESARPRHWVDDLAVFHFVSAKLCMERDELEEAEQHLHTALGLGLDRPSVKLNLAVLKVRQCALGAALRLIDDVELSDDPAILEQARVMREVIAKVKQGDVLPEITERSARFRKKHLKAGDADPEAALQSLSDRLREGAKLSGKDREDAILLYGSLLVAARQGTWLFGLEPRDHRVLISGVLYHPAEQVDEILGGQLEQLPLPPAPPALSKGS